MRIINRKRSTSGFSLVEVAVATTIFGLMSGAAILVTNGSVGAYENARLVNAVETKVHRALARVSREVIASAVGQLTPATLDDDYGSSDITFQQATDYVAGVGITWGPITRFRFEYAGGEVDDGIDNDGDGLVDEGVLVMIQNEGAANEMRIVMCSNVRERMVGETLNNADDNGNGVRDEGGFNIHRSGDVLTIRLCVQELNDRAGTITRTQTTSVRLRN